MRSNSPALSSQEDDQRSYNSDSMSTGYSPMRKKNRPVQEDDGDSEFRDVDEPSQIETRPLVFTTSIASTIHGGEEASQRGMPLFFSQASEGPFTQDFLNNSQMSQIGNGNPYHHGGGMFGRFGPNAGSNNGRNGGVGLFSSQESVSFNQSTLSIPSASAQQGQHQQQNLVRNFVFSPSSQDMADRFEQMHVQPSQQQQHHHLQHHGMSLSGIAGMGEDSFQMIRCSTSIFSQGNTQLDSEMMDGDSNSQASYDPANALASGSQGNSNSMPPPDRADRDRDRSIVPNPNQLTQPSSHHTSASEFAKPNAPSSKMIKPPPTAMKASRATAGTSTGKSSSTSKASHHQTTTSSNSATTTNNNSNMILVESERQVELHPVVKNPFLTYSAPSNPLVFNHPAEEYFERLDFVTSSSFSGGSAGLKVSNSNANTNGGRRRGVGTTIVRSSLLPKLQKVWVSPYDERSRYYSEFEEVLTLGAGTFSKVICVRHRLDGMLYAIKHIQEKIHSKKRELELLREVNALALLSNTSCPHLIRYYTSWIEGQQLYIQLELCEIGCLEDLIAKKPTRYSLFATNLHRFTATELEDMKAEILAMSGTGRASDNNHGGNKTGIQVNTNQNPHEFETFQITPTTSITGYPMNNLSQPNRPPSKFTFENTNSCVIASTPINDEVAAYSFQAAPTNPTYEANIFDDSVMMRTQLDDEENNQHVGSSRQQPTEISFRGIREELAWKILTIVGETLEFMHNHGLVHLDLRPANVFLQESFQSTPLFNPNALGTSKSTGPSSLFDKVTKSSGLGSAAAPPSLINPDAFTNNKEARDEVEEGILSGKYVIKVGDLGHCRGLFERGSLDEGENRYCPRELINSDADSLDLTKADMFSLGASVYELCLGRFLGSSGEEEMVEWHSIRDGFLHDSFFAHYSNELCQVIQQCLHQNPSERPSAQALLQITRRKQG